MQKHLEETRLGGSTARKEVHEMGESLSEKTIALRYKVWEIHARFYTVKGRKTSYSKRKLKNKILELLSIRTSKYLGNIYLGKDQVATLYNEASSQIQRLLKTVKIGSYEGYTYGMEVSMIVTDLLDGERMDITFSKVFYRDFKSLVRDRGLLGRDHSWLINACEMAKERQVTSI